MRFNGSCCYCSRILGIFLEYVDPWYVVPIKWLSMLLLANITFVLASFQEMFIGLFILVVYYRIRKNEKSSRLNTFILVVYYKMRENPLDSRFLPNFLKGKDLKRTKQIHYIFSILFNLQPLPVMYWGIRVVLGYNASEMIVVWSSANVE